jgi:integrase/recombinase XerC
MSEYGELEYAEGWARAPIRTYLQHKREREDVTERRLTQIRRVVTDSPPDSEYEAWDEHVEWRGGMSVADGWQFLGQLRAAGLAERTVAEYTRIVQSFLNTLLQRGVVSSNPVAYVRDQTTFDAETTPKVERTVADVASFLSSVPEPQYRAAGVLFAKTGVRNGECVNVDLPHLHLDHAGYYRFLDERDITLHERVRDAPDSLYVPSEPTMGEVYRGERREAGNKRRRDTVVPIDRETKTALLDWLAQRPATGPPHPLWTGKEGRDRISMHSFGSLLTGRYAAESGFVADSSEPGFTPHWFRHMFTTQLKPGHGDHPRSVEPTVLRYLRGDVVDDITSVYTHDWGNTVRPAYLDAIYQFELFE